MNRRDRHFHLIDGADGGYALAAEQLKARLQGKAQNWPTYSNLAITVPSASLPARAGLPITSAGATPPT
jgi:hypothetical protein